MVFYIKVDVCFWLGEVFVCFLIWRWLRKKWLEIVLEEKSKYMKFFSILIFLRKDFQDSQCLFGLDFKLSKRMEAVAHNKPKWLFSAANYFLHGRARKLDDWFALCTFHNLGHGQSLPSICIQTEIVRSNSNFWIIEISV